MDTKTLEKLQRIYDQADSFGKSLMEKEFPELKESDDERIRKELLQNLKERFGTRGSMGRNLDMPTVIAWFEKKGEQKPVSITDEQIEDYWKHYKVNNPHSYDNGDEIQFDHDGFVRFCKQFSKPIDNVEPKFHEGDWVVQGYNILKIKCVSNPLYCFETVSGYVGDMLVSEIDSQYHLWTIRDAKNGDVLACPSGWTCIFKSLYGDTFSSYCFIDKTGWFCEKGSECHTLNKEFTKAYNGEIKPATKEQRNLLFQKMKEAGYEWDAEKKELKKIEQKPTEWSDRDWYYYSKLESFLEVKDHYSPTESSSGYQKDVHETLIWLKSLKERYTWKPSDEQMEALLKLEEMHVLEHEKTQENAHLYMVIKNIREQLQKLRNE